MEVEDEIILKLAPVNLVDQIKGYAMGGSGLEKKIEWVNFADFA